MKANFQVKAFFDFTASTRLFGRLKFYLRFVLDNWCIFICFAYTQYTTDCLYSIGTFRYHLLFRLIGEIFGFTLSRLAFRIITNCSVSILFANTATVMWSENKKTRSDVCMAQIINWIGQYFQRIVLFLFHAATSIFIPKTLILFKITAVKIRHCLTYIDKALMRSRELNKAQNW